MRTTIEIPDSLFKEAKANAARRGMSLRALITDALEHELRAPMRPTRRRVRLPLVRSKRPGHLTLTNAQIENLLE